MKLHTQGGQVVVEYILLLVIAVMMAALIIRLLASRGDNPGVLIQKWNDIQKQIGSDVSDN